jgi:hypothetical protein
MGVMRRSALIVICGLMVAGCAGGSNAPRPETPGTGPSLATTGARVSKVVVSVADAVQADARDVIAAYRVAESLTSQITSRTGTGGDVTLNVTISKLRLRSGFSAFMWGIMAGPDFLDVTVAAEQRGAVVRAFDTGAGSAVGGLIYMGRTVRVNRLIDAVAERVAKGL